MQSFEDSFSTTGNLKGVEAFNIDNGKMYLLVGRKPTKLELVDMEADDPDFDPDKAIIKEYVQASPEQQARLISVLKSEYGLDYSDDLIDVTDTKSEDTETKSEDIETKSGGTIRQ